MVDYIADYLGSIRRRRVFPDVKPGYMKDLLPDSAPEEGESFDSIFADIEKVIMPGITHWQSPHMHAYFPALNSPASLLGDMLADGLGCLAFTWASSPACTELEIIVMDWLAKLIGLPEQFLHVASRGKGGGVIQTTASESTLISLLAARTEAFRRYRERLGDVADAEINNMLVAYTSDQAHSSVEKAGIIGLVQMRYIESDDKFSLRGDRLTDAIRRDKEKGLIPFFLCATLGTTGACAFDNIKELGPICEKEGLWMHIDAAYAGSAFICPEFRHWLEGVEYADTIAFNPSKWLMVHFDCTAMWVKNSESLHRTFNVNPLYLKHENTGLAVDFMHWQISLSKRFRALKLWFVLRNLGAKGLQQHIRHGVELAEEFESLVQSDDRFEIPAKRNLGMVVFRIKGKNKLTKNLLKKINSSGKLHCVPSLLKEKYIIRFTVASPQTTIQDIRNDWDLIQRMSSQLLNSPNCERRPVSVSEIIRRNPNFSTNLLIDNNLKHSKHHPSFGIF